MLSFTVKTMTGEIIPVEYEADELTVPGIYHCVILRLEQEDMKHVVDTAAASWNIELLPAPSPDGEVEDEDEGALQELVKQGGMLSLLVHTGRRLDTSVHWHPFLYLYEGKRFVRCTFDAEFHKDGHGQVWSVEAYLCQADGQWQMYHAKDVVLIRNTCVFQSMEHPCTGEQSVYELMLRSYEHEPGVWSITPFHLLPSLYQEWNDILETAKARISAFLQIAQA